jgi:hypothetical protein
MSQPALPSAKRTFSTSALLTRIVVAALGLALFTEPGARLLLHLDGLAGPLMKSDAYWYSLLAPFFFLGALKQAADVFARIDRGDAFGPAMVCGLKQIGYCLMIGAFVASVVQPALIYLTANGFSEMRGVRFDFQIEIVTLALVGIVLILLARQGQQLKSKLDEFV